MTDPIIMRRMQVLAVILGWLLGFGACQQNKWISMKVNVTFIYQNTM